MFAKRRGAYGLLSGGCFCRLEMGCRGRRRGCGEGAFERVFGSLFVMERKRED